MNDPKKTTVQQAEQARLKLVVVIDHVEVSLAQILADIDDLLEHLREDEWEDEHAS